MGKLLVVDFLNLSLISLEQEKTYFQVFEFGGNEVIISWSVSYLSNREMEIAYFSIQEKAIEFASTVNVIEVFRSLVV
jgi:hypothetical protein